MLYTHRYNDSLKVFHNTILNENYFQYRTSIYVHEFKIFYRRIKNSYRISTYSLLY
jgi:hypothetical protein